uniref:RxLR effector protein n=1 Tax=Peronospora matthiolae TaxID=2874970 RepID=A0AAV1TAC2_9STRA
MRWLNIVQALTIVLLSTTDIVAASGNKLSTSTTATDGHRQLRSLATTDRQVDDLTDVSATNEERLETPILRSLGVDQTNEVVSQAAQTADIPPGTEVVSKYYGNGVKQKIGRWFHKFVGQGPARRLRKA